MLRPRERIPFQRLDRIICARGSRASSSSISLTPMIAFSEYAARGSCWRETVICAHWPPRAPRSLPQARPYAERRAGRDGRRGCGCRLATGGSRRQLHRSRRASGPGGRCSVNGRVSSFGVREAAKSAMCCIGNCNCRRRITEVTMQISPIRRPNAPSTRSTSPTRTVYRCSTLGTSLQVYRAALAYLRGRECPGSPYPRRRGGSRCRFRNAGRLRPPARRMRFAAARQSIATAGESHLARCPRG